MLRKLMFWREEETEDQREKRLIEERRDFERREREAERRLRALQLEAATIQRKRG